jgi:mannose-6-phosphate isomerase-like protein (cupin superfamily)
VHEPELTIRRLVVVDEGERSRIISDGASPDVRMDPARPGYSCARIWVNDRTPARIAGVLETLDMSNVLLPPPNGSVCNIVTFPPDASYGKVSAENVQNFFTSVGALGAYAPNGLHPYMQKSQTLDFCLVLEGEVTLILDTEEVALKAGDTVVQRGTRHAWSNRSTRPCVVAFSSHDAVYEAPPRSP